MAGSRLGPRRHFGEHQPALVEGLLPLLIFGRVKDVDAAGDDRDRPAIEGPVVGGAVDPAGQPRHDDQVALAKIVGEAAREAAGCRRGVAGADHRDRLPIEQANLPLRDQQRRRILQLCQQARIEALPERQPLRAELLDPVDLTLGAVPGAQYRRPAASATREIGNGGQRLGGAAEAGTSWRYVTGPIPASAPASGGRRGLRSYAWLGSFRQAKDIFAMLPQDEQRETEQHWEEQRMDESRQ